MTMHSLNKGNRGWVPLLEVIVLVLKKVASWNRATVLLCLSKDVVVSRGRRTRRCDGWSCGMGWATAAAMAAATRTNAMESLM